MKKWLGFFVLISFGLQLVSCQLLGASKTNDRKLTIALMQPFALGKDVQITQQVDMQWQASQHSLLVVWSQQAGVMQVAGLTLAGQLLFRAQFDGQDYSQQILLAELAHVDLQQLVQHIQRAYWPVDVVRQSLQEIQAELTVEEHERLISLVDNNLVRYQFEVEGDRDREFPSVAISAQGQPNLRVETLTVETIIGTPND